MAALATADVAGASSEAPAPRGIFAGVTLNGSTIRQDRDANERFYGIAYRTTQIVNQRLGGAPEPAPAWKAALVKHAGGNP